MLWDLPRGTKLHTWHQDGAGISSVVNDHRVALVPMKDPDFQVVVYDVDTGLHTNTFAATTSYAELGSGTHIALSGRRMVGLAHGHEGKAMVPLQGQSGIIEAFALYDTIVFSTVDQFTV